MDSSLSAAAAATTIHNNIASHCKQTNSLEYSPTDCSHCLPFTLDKRKSFSTRQHSANTHRRQRNLNISEIFIILYFIGSANVSYICAQDKITNRQPHIRAWGNCFTRKFSPRGWADLYQNSRRSFHIV